MIECLISRIDKNEAGVKDETLNHGAVVDNEEEHRKSWSRRQAAALMTCFDGFISNHFAPICSTSSNLPRLGPSLGLASVGTLHL